MKNVLILFLTLKVYLVYCFCEDSYIVICHSIQDVRKAGGKSYWTELLIQSDECTMEEPLYSLQENYLDYFYSLKRLTIVNQLNKIEPFSFNSLAVSMKNLVIYGNDLDVIEGNTFTRLDLEKLDLRNNGIKRLDVCSISNCKIKILDLSYNSLQVLEADIFQSSTIEKLIIRHNKLSSVEFNALPFGVKCLYLDYNEFEVFSLLSLNRSHTVEELKISHNKLFSISAFSTFFYVKVLDLSYNRLYTFSWSPTILKHRRKIKFISLAYNRLRSLDLDVLQNSGITFALRGNPWSCKCASRMTKILTNFSSGLHWLKCDQDLIKSGKVPFCAFGVLHFNQECPAGDSLPEEYHHDFQWALSKSDNCNQLLWGD